MAPYFVLCLHEARFKNPAARTGKNMPSALKDLQYFLNAYVIKTGQRQLGTAITGAATRNGQIATNHRKHIANACQIFFFACRKWHVCHPAHLAWSTQQMHILLNDSMINPRISPPLPATTYA